MPTEHRHCDRRTTDRIGGGASPWTLLLSLIIGAQAVAVFVLLGMFQSISNTSHALSAEQGMLKDRIVDAEGYCRNVAKEALGR